MARAAAATWILLSMLAPATAPAQPCKMSVAQGFLELQRARFPAALTQFDQALSGVDECVAEAHLGKASTYNAMNDHKLAVAEAQRVFGLTDDAEVLAETHYQVGVALHRRGSRMNKKKAEAEAAFRRAIDVSGGEHRGAIRALWRLLDETRRKDDLAALQERFPGMQVLSRGERMRSARSNKKGGARKGPPCRTDDNAGWDDDLPYFLADENPEAEGYAPPRLTAGGKPEYTDAARKEGIEGRVEIQARIDTEGHVIQVRVLKSLHPDLDAAAVEAACQFEFEPARSPEGEPTAAFLRGVFDFAPE